MGKTPSVVAMQIAQNEESMDGEIVSAFNKVMEEFDCLRDIISFGSKVLIKPNLVAPFEKATTNMLLLECMIRLVQSNNATAIIAESSGFEFSTAESFKILGINELCKKYKVELIDLDLAEYVKVPSGNSKAKVYLLPKIVFEVDRIINMPCLKGHSLTKVTFGIKNLFGLLHRETRRKIHSTNLDNGIAALSKLINVDFTFVDGLWKLDSAVYDDNPEFQGIFIAGCNLLEVDCACCAILGISHMDIGHINKSVTAGCNDHQNVKYLTPVSASNTDFSKKSEHYRKQNKKYKLMYKTDAFVYSIFKKTIIPYLHYYLGLRPSLDRKKCIKCNKCVNACPASAIENYKIISSMCMMVRCFRCYEICENNAIMKVGFHQ